MDGHEGTEAIVVELTDATRAGADHERLRTLVRSVLAAEGVLQAEVGLHLVGERRMAALNADYRGVHGVTDVLSFPLEEPGDPVPAGVPRLLGDVVVCPVQARRQATADGTPPAFELALLVTHGLLHLLGWEHDDDPGDMALRQGQILADWDWSGLW